MKIPNIAGMMYLIAVDSSNCLKNKSALTWVNNDRDGIKLFLQLKSDTLKGDQCTYVLENADERYPSCIKGIFNRQYDFILLWSSKSSWNTNLAQKVDKQKIV